MENLKKFNKSVVKEDEIRESSKKHDVNLRNNSSLYFQVGLILSLLATYGLFQMEFEKPNYDFALLHPFDEPSVIFIRETPIVPEEPIKKRQPDKKVVVLTTIAPKIIDDHAVVDVPDIKMPDEVVPDKPTTPSVSIPEEPKKNKPTEWNLIDVEKVPIFPGCESAKNNAERMACMSEKLTKLIQKKFNTYLAQDLGLSGIQRIQVQFKIDDAGHVTDIKTRSPYSELANEAERVVSKIPVMKPAIQNNTPVSVVYQLPIAFQVN